MNKMLRTLGVFFAAVVAMSAQEPLLSLADLNALERENALWRSVKVDADLDANVRKLQSAGFTLQEIAAVMPRWQAIWENPMPRQFGWLSNEAIEKVRAVDEVYLARLRAARLRIVVGVQLPEFKKEAPLWVNAQWRRAVIRVLDYGEIAEFTRMNSQFARRVSENADSLELSTDERRTLIDWEREFAVTHGNPANWNAAVPSERAWHEEARAELHDRTRALLGDERAVDYLGASNAEFDRMCTALTDLNLGATKLLELWVLRREHRRLSALDGSVSNRKMLQQNSREQVTGLLGEEIFKTYAQLDEAKWLFPRVMVKPLKAEAIAQAK